MTVSDYFKLVICVVLITLLLVDCVKKFRDVSVIRDLRHWGFLPPFYVTLLGGVSLYVIGWHGWVLVLVGAIVSTATLNVQRVDAPGEDTQSVDALVRSSMNTQAYLLGACELFCLCSLLLHVSLLLSILLKTLFQ